MEELPSIHEPIRMVHRHDTSLERRKYSRKDQIQLLFRLEAKFQWHDERVVHPRENKSLRKGMRNLSSFDNVLFPDRLQSVYPAGIEFAYLQDLKLSQRTARRKPPAGLPMANSRRDREFRSLVVLIRTKDETQIGELAFPKLPFPITVISSKSSMLKGPY